MPAGVDTGVRLRLSGEGEPGSKGGPAGDLYVSLSVGKHEFFSRNEYDILCVVPVSFPQLALGDEITVPGVEENSVLTIPPGTPSGHIFRVRSKGVKKLDGRGRGDQLIKVEVDVPKNLNARQKQILKDFGSTLEEGKAPDPDNIVDKVKKFFN